jgi:hypothetical protein
MSDSSKKVQMNFNAPVAGAVGNVENDFILYSSPEQSVVEEKLRKAIEKFKVAHHNSMELEIAIQSEFESNPTFRIRLQSALKAAGIETAKVVFSPLGIGIEAIRGWLEAQ